MKNSNMALKILVVDDHRLFRESLSYVLQLIDSNVIITELSSPSETLSVFEMKSDWDLVLFDLSFPYENIWGCLSSIMYRHPKLRVAILSGSYDLQSIKKALELNISGLISKTSSAHELITSIKNIVAGDHYVSADLRELYTTATRDTDDMKKSVLTIRQKEVLNLLHAGLSNKAIANLLDISESTTKQHVSCLINSLKARNRTDAVIKAQHLGLVTGNQADNS